ncbi:MAG: DUF4279 domain-containing protein [Anaerolineales bacterium]|nr:DUF4279 domain-containing protein [Anaerolineales bacterium]
MSDTQYDQATNGQAKNSNGRLYVSFTITGKDLNSDDLTARLGVKPTLSFKRGDVKANTDEQQQLWQHGCWSIDSDNKGFSSNNPQPHFEWLLGVLTPVEEELKEILANKNVDARVSCFWIMPDGRISMEIEPELLLRLAKLNVKIWFDIHCDH